MMTRFVGSAVIVYNPFQFFVYRFSIDPNYQGKGVGRLLSEKVDETLRRKGMYNPTIFVEEDNQDALEFWQRMVGNGYIVFIVSSKIYESDLYGLCKRDKTN